MRSTGQTSLQQQGIQPTTVLESDRPEPSGIDETAITVQRKRSRTIRVDDHGDDFADADAYAVVQEGVEKTTADAAANRMGCEVDRILDGVPVSRSGLPRCAVGVADDLVRPWRQSGTATQMRWRCEIDAAIPGDRAA